MERGRPPGAAGAADWRGRRRGGRGVPGPCPPGRGDADDGRGPTCGTAHRTWHAGGLQYVATVSTFKPTRTPPVRVGLNPTPLWGHMVVISPANSAALADLHPGPGHRDPRHSAVALPPRPARDYMNMVTSLPQSFCFVPCPFRNLVGFLPLFLCFDSCRHSLFSIQRKRPLRCASSIIVIFCVAPLYYWHLAYHIISAFWVCGSVDTSRCPLAPRPAPSTTRISPPPPPPCNGRGGCCGCCGRAPALPLLATPWMTGPDGGAGKMR